ncbi:glycosyltransferase family 4 protein [Candidatus Pacearchaeota archaeon]|nr:glycosyltransferase family 4 protein [Candidatus Pacearchaeota archaeon]
MKQKKKILLIGPYPPPEHGTSIPFKIFCDFLKENIGANYHICILNSQTGDKAVEPLFSPSVILRVAKLFFSLIISMCSSKKIIIFGSQRFVSFTGLIVLILRPLGKEVSIRINGGAYEIYLEKMPFLLRTIVKKTLGLCCRIVVETEVVASQLKFVWPKQLRVVSNYRNPIDGINYEKSNSNKQVKFIYTGVIRRSKGCQELIDAFLILKKRFSESKIGIRLILDFYGPIYDRDIIDERTLDLNDDSRITFHGNISQSQLIEAYKLSDVFVFPSYWQTEGHSGALVEAMMVGFPVVAARWRATPEIIKDGQNGLLCSPKDVNSLVDCMEKMALDDKLRAKLAKAAFETSKRFNANIVCKQLAKALNLSC